ncbi:MAG TPA: hypothetical protein VNF46_05455, partial [Gammaproteobacteria bacterium]|nr:hypothetical protein [Gammaproteobacteria bacterium]
QKLPPNDLAAIVAQQWSVANTAILDNLSRLPTRRWCSLTYEEFTTSPADTIKKLFEFCDLSPTMFLDNSLNRGLPLSRYTLTPPSADKWLRHAKDIEAVMDMVEPVHTRIHELGNRL